MSEGGKKHSSREQVNLGVWQKHQREGKNGIKEEKASPLSNWTSHSVALSEPNGMNPFYCYAVSVKTVWCKKKKLVKSLVKLIFFFCLRVKNSQRGDQSSGLKPVSMPSNSRDHPEARSLFPLPHGTTTARISRSHDRTQITITLKSMLTVLRP